MPCTCTCMMFPDIPSCQCCRGWRLRVCSQPALQNAGIASVSYFQARMMRSGTILSSLFWKLASFISTVSYNGNNTKDSEFKLCVPMHCCLTGAAPRYLTELPVPVASTARCRLRSVSSADRVMPSTRRSALGDRAFAVAGPWDGTAYHLTFDHLHHHSHLRNI